VSLCERHAESLFKRLLELARDRFSSIPGLCREEVRTFLR
jgi:hypothetical protein